MTDSWGTSESRRLSRMMKFTIFFYLISIVSCLTGPLHEDVLNDAERYRQLRLEHLRRHRRQQPKEISIQVSCALLFTNNFNKLRI